MWNEHWYLASTIYRSNILGARSPMTALDLESISEVIAPYWRAAWQTPGENNSRNRRLRMHVKSTPNAVTGLEDGYTDIAADFQFDRTIPSLKNDVLSSAAPISEKTLLCWRLLMRRAQRRSVTT